MNIIQIGLFAYMSRPFLSFNILDVLLLVPQFPSKRQPEWKGNNITTWSYSIVGGVEESYFLNDH